MRGEICTLGGGACTLRQPICRPQQLVRGSVGELSRDALVRDVDSSFGNCAHDGAILQLAAEAGHGPWRIVREERRDAQAEQHAAERTRKQRRLTAALSSWQAKQECC